MHYLRFALTGMVLGVAQLLALPVFPGAAGFGSHTVAGRGGQLYRVTNLNDRGPGSLRHGIQELQGPRVIIFDVSGVIELDSDILLSDSKGDRGYLTIAGQTAPPPGITLKNYGIAIRSHDVLIQHIAIRPGTDSGAFGNRDAIKIEAPVETATHHIVIDHVSTSWASDETISVWANEQGAIHDVTISNSIISEALRHPAPQMKRSYGGLAGRNTIGVSFIGNIFALNQSRNPLIRDSVLNSEVVNNLIYWPHYDEKAAIYFGSAHPEHPDLSLIASVAGNVIIRRPSGEWEGQHVNGSTIGIYVHDDAPTEMSLYLENNWVLNPDTSVWHPTDGKPFSNEIYRVGKLVPRTWTSNPFSFTHANPWMDSPEEIEQRLRRGAGKQPAFRDPIDAGLIQTIEARTGRWVQSMADLGPDPWAPANVENRRVLELPLRLDEDDDNDGYTNLEEWLHGWAAYVEGRAPSPPRTSQTGDMRKYESPGVDEGLPVFVQNIKDRIEHPLSWNSGRFTDFEQWKTTAKERVRRAWMQPPPDAPWDVVITGEEDRGSYVVRKLVFNISGDSRVEAYLSVPKGEGPFPAVLLLHDHGGLYEIGKEKVIRLFGAPEDMTKASEVWVGRLYGGRYISDELAKRGYVTFVTDAINWGYRGGGGAAGQQALASNLMHFGMSFAGVIAWEDQRAAEFLAQRPEVDPKRIAAMGLSMGGNRTWQVAAMSDHIAAGVSICWMTTVKAVIGPGTNSSKGASAFSMLHPGLLEDLDYPDIASLAAPKPMLFYTGRLDRLFPQSSVNEAFAKMRTVWNSQNAGERLETRTWNVEHVFNVEMQEAAFDWLDGFMKSGR